MIALNEQLTGNIESILRTVRAMELLSEKSDELSSEQKQLLSLRCAEVALLSLAASDELDGAASPTERMIRHELASALRQIALQCLNVQEWESSANIVACIAAVSKRCDFIAGILKLPKEAHAEGMELVPLARQMDDSALEILAAHQDDAQQEDKLRGEIQALREILTVLVLERDKLQHSTCKELEAAYMRELGSIEAEIYRAECEIRYLRRKTEMMRAALNRREPIRTAKIDETLKGQFNEHQKAYEAFKRRVADAESFQKKKADNAEPDRKEEESEEQRIKKLYRKIVKALHPDIHSRQSEEEKALFKRANLAYEAGDYKTLHEIAATIDGDHADSTEGLIEELRREKNCILTLIRSVKAEIHLIKSRYPYTKKEILEDPEKLAAERERLTAKLDAARRNIETYKKHIAEMEQHGRADAPGE